MTERLNSYVCAMCIDEKTGLPMPKMYIGDDDCTPVDGFNTAMVLDDETGKPMMKVKFVGVDLPMMEEQVMSQFKDITSIKNKVDGHSMAIEDILARLSSLEEKAGVSE